MADKKISQLPPKGSPIAFTDLVEIAEDNGFGNYVTKSVSGLQPALVSGTDIVTINSQTLLVSGNLSLQTPLVSGTDIKTINSNSILGSGDLVVGGGGFHVLSKPQPTWLNLAQGYLNNISTTSLSNGVNNMMLSLFYPANTFTISELSINVTTAAGSSSNAKILVYTDDGFGYPRVKIIESSSLSLTTTGAKIFLTSYTFTAGTRYWMGVIIDASAGAVVSGLGSAVLLSRMFNYTIPHTGMYISAPFATTPALNTSAATSGNMQSAAVYFKI